MRACVCLRACGKKAYAFEKQGCLNAMLRWLAFLSDYLVARVQHQDQAKTKAEAQQFMCEHLRWVCTPTAVFYIYYMHRQLSIGYWAHTQTAAVALWSWQCHCQCKC